MYVFVSIMELTRLDSSGDAKLNNNTLTFTVKVPESGVLFQAQRNRLDEEIRRRQLNWKVHRE